MKLAQLDKESWDAAFASARILMSCSPNREDDRARFRAANDALIALLPVGVDHRDLVLEAAKYDAANFIADVVAGLPQSKGITA